MADIEAKRSCFDLLDARTGRIQAIIGGAKTGTMTIAAGLRNHGVEPVRSHTLMPERLAAREALYPHDPDQLWKIWEAQWLSANPPTEMRPWSLVTTVRDPVARMVSGFFHLRGRSGIDPHTVTPDLLVDELTARFAGEVERLATRPPDWYDLNLRDCIGVQLYDHPFDPAAGFGRVVTDRVDVIVLRTESLDRASEALGSFFGLEGPVDMTAENATRDTTHGELFGATLERFCLPAEWASRMYDQPIARHFYSEDERDRFRQRWTGAT